MKIYFSSWAKGETTLPVSLIGNRLVFHKDCQVYVPQPLGSGIWLNFQVNDWWDGASIPQWAWSIIGHPFTEEFRFASLIHDEYCKHAKTYEDRRIGDSQFLYLLNLTNIHKTQIPRWKLKAMYLAVRLNSRFLLRPS